LCSLFSTRSAPLGKTNRREKNFPGQRSANAVLAKIVAPPMHAARADIGMTRVVFGARALWQVDVEVAKRRPRRGLELVPQDAPECTVCAIRLGEVFALAKT
jgi:hypothetical protein